MCVIFLFLLCNKETLIFFLCLFIYSIEIKINKWTNKFNWIISTTVTIHNSIGHNYYNYCSNYYNILHTLGFRTVDCFHNKPNYYPNYNKSCCMELIMMWLTLMLRLVYRPLVPSFVAIHWNIWSWKKIQFHKKKYSLSDNFCTGRFSFF